jgi:hypothetical protein
MRHARLLPLCGNTSPPEAMTPTRLHEQTILKDSVAYDMVLYKEALAHFEARAQRHGCSLV